MIIIFYTQVIIIFTFKGKNKKKCTPTMPIFFIFK